MPVVEDEGMRKQGRGRNPLFAKRWIADEVIIVCVRWYLRFRLSYRDLSSIAAELGIAVAPPTILRWVVRYTGEFVRRWDPFELIVGRSWLADETYIKVNGGVLLQTPDRTAGEPNGNVTPDAPMLRQP
jgi:transposase, IS6 family